MSGGLESYCPALDCDCRLVRLEVADVAAGTCKAVITYRFDGGATPAGRNPYLEPVGGGDEDACALLDLVTHLIEDDADYRERLQRHYAELKRFFRDHPEHPIHEAVRRDDEVMDALVRDVLSPSPSPSPFRARRLPQKRRQKKAQRAARKRNRRKR